MDMPTTSDQGWLRERQIVMACVSHLVKRKQHEVDRIVRILRSEFVADRPRSPKRGSIRAIVLVGRQTEREVPDKETGDCNAYEIWVVVDHPEFRGLEKTWGPARELIGRELRGRCTVELSVFDEADLARAMTDNGMIREKAGNAVVLYDARQPAATCQDVSSSSP